MYPLANVLGPLGHRPYSLPWSSGSSLLTGLVSWWNLDETSGTRADSVGSNHLTDVNTVGYAAGKIGNAASFVAANNETLSTETALFEDDFTLSMWVKTPLTGTIYILEGADPPNTPNGPLLYWTNATNRWSFSQQSTLGVIIDVATTDQWRHLVM